MDFDESIFHLAVEKIVALSENEVLFKVGGMVTDKKPFDKAADEFLKANPQYKSGSYRVSTGTQSGGSGAAQNTNDLINNNIRNAFLK